jgi:hypothetical protein
VRNFPGGNGSSTGAEHSLQGFNRACLQLTHQRDGTLGAFVIGQRLRTLAQRFDFRDVRLVPDALKIPMPIAKQDRRLIAPRPS